MESLSSAFCWFIYWSKEDNLHSLRHGGEVWLLHDDDKKHKIHLLCIIGEIEGHEVLGNNTKTTKYEHVLPKLAEFEDNDEMEGLLVLLQTCGGDVESGLAIAEMIGSSIAPSPTQTDCSLFANVVSCVK